MARPAQSPVNPSWSHVSIDSLPLLSVLENTPSACVSVIPSSGLSLCTNTASASTATLIAVGW